MDTVLSSAVMSFIEITCVVEINSINFMIKYPNCKVNSLRASGGGGGMLTSWSAFHNESLK